MGEFMAIAGRDVYHAVLPFCSVTACGVYVDRNNFFADDPEKLLDKLQPLEAGFRRRPCRTCLSTEWMDGE